MRFRFLFVRVFSVLIWLLVSGLSVVAQTNPPAGRTQPRPQTPAKPQSQNPPPARNQTPAQAQTPAQTQPQPNDDQIELVQADALEGGKFKGQEVRKLIGNVVFKQKGSFLYCDSAYQYKTKNAIEAFSNVRINQADTVTVTGDRLTYNGDTRVAKMTGNVVLNDSKMTLNTPALDYNMTTKQASYNQGGVIVDAENRLTSQFGQYSTATKVFNFRNNVVINTKDGVIESAALDYNTVTKVAFFNGPTKIINPQGTLLADQGSYNTVSKVANFTQNARIETPEYILGGDVLVYNQFTGYGKATGNVRMTSKKDSVLITGNIGQYWKSRGLSKVYGNAVMHRPVGLDTLLLAADTLMSIESKVDTLPSYTIAYPNVRIFKSDMQGRCDSLTYNSLDSTLYMHFDPILWSDQNQIVAQHIRLLMKGKQLDRMEAYTNAFLSSEDTLKNYNQVKGRDMTAFFRENKLDKVNVNGNAESIYFALEGDTALTGMNYAVCSNMVIRFDSNQVKTISFLTSPDARFVPPHELQVTDRSLANFTWRIGEKPSRSDIAQDSRPRKERPKPVVEPAPEKPVTPAKPAKKTNAADDKKKETRNQRQPNRPRTNR